MAFQNLPPAAESYSREQRRLIAGSVAAVRAQWRRMGDDFDSSWSSVGPAILAITNQSQARIAEDAAEYVPTVLRETSSTPLPAAAGDVVPSSLVGVAGDGRPTESLLYGAVTRSRLAMRSPRPTVDELGDPVDYGPRATPRQALLAGLSWLTMATATLLSDTGRAAETVGMATFPGVRYVRILTPPSCSRCAVLAGRDYNNRQAFQRHPNCDCRHLPYRGEGMAEDIISSPEEYFDTLSAAEQSRIFTNAGAEAIREGADINQVVNARRGMLRAQSGRLRRTASGQFETVEGVTRHGLYGRSGGGRPRLMPESIQEMSRTREEYLEGLRRYGYLRAPAPRFITNPDGSLTRIS